RGRRAPPTSQLSAYREWEGNPRTMISQRGELFIIQRGPRLPWPRRRPCRTRSRKPRAAGEGMPERRRTAFSSRRPDRGRGGGAKSPTPRPAIELPLAEDDSIDSL